MCGAPVCWRTAGWMMETTDQEADELPLCQRCLTYVMGQLEESPFFEIAVLQIAGKQVTVATLLDGGEVPQRVYLEPIG